MMDMPAEWFVDNRRPEVGEIWEDAEGVLYTVAPGTGITNTGMTTIPLWAFATSNLVPIHRETVTKPLERAFDVNGNFVLQRPLRYPDNSNIRRN